MNAPLTAGTSAAIRRGLPPGAALLVGRLVLVASRRAPVLVLRVWCPWCRMEHVHGWPDADARLDAVSHRVAHCDPARRVEHRKLLAEFTRLTAKEPTP